MADEQENLKIVIEVVDKFSKPLIDLKNQLQVISGQGEGPKKVASNFNTLRESMIGVSRTVTSFVMPSLKVLGLGFAGLSATIAGAVASLKGFATNIADLSRLSRETGLTIDKMRELEAAGRRVGVSANEMRAGFRAFSDEVDKMRVGVSTAANEMRQRGLGFVVEGLKARTGDLNKQLDYALSIMDRISNPRHKREFARMIGLPENFGTLSGKERQEAIAEWKKTNQAVTKEAEEASKRFQLNMERLANSMEGLVNKLAESGALDAIATSLKSIADNLELLVGKAAAAKKAVEENQAAARAPVLKRPESPGRPLTLWEQLFGLNNPLFGTGPGGGGGTFKPGNPASGGKDPKELLKQGTLEGSEEGVFRGLVKFSSTFRPAGGPGIGPGGERVIPVSLPRSSDRTRGALTSGGGGQPVPRSSAAPVPPMGSRAAAGAPATAGGGTDTSNDSKAVPSDILAQAQRVAASGGPGAVAEYMRQKGHPKSGAWCGQFAAAVVRGAGGTPPANPEVASNWRNFGDRVYGRPQPGDVAVRRGTATGRTGSHVTVVESYDPETGKFTGIGGNQGRMRSQYSERGRRGYDFYRSRQKETESTGVPLPRPRPDVPRERMYEQGGYNLASQKIEGDASLRIDLNGFPKGTNFTSSASGMFSSVELHRGNTVPLASETG